MLRTSVLLVSVLVAGMPVVARAAGPVIGIGDTIDISVLGIPDMQKRAVVNEDGRISYPMLGVIKAEGLSEEQLRQSLADQLVNGALLKDPRIGIEIVSRPPYYVTGEVAKPGAQPYAPNMTVRTAVALAGGVDLIGLPGGRTESPSGDSRGQLENVAFDFVRQRAHLLRLEAELSGKGTVELEKSTSLPISDEVVARLNALELQDFQTRRDETQKEKLYLNTMIAKVKDQAAALVLRRKSQEESIRDRESEIAKFKSLADRGIVIQSRVLDEQRSMLLLRTALYESVASEAQASLVLEEYQHKLASIDEARRLSVIKEMQDAYVATAALQGRVAAAQRIMAARGNSSAVSYVIFRRANGRQVRLDADEVTEVLPGDMIEVGIGANTTVAAH